MREIILQRTIRNNVSRLIPIYEMSDLSYNSILMQHIHARRKECIADAKSILEILTIVYRKLLARVMRAVC